MRVILWTVAIAALLDQISKYVVIHMMELWRVGEIDVYPPFLNFRYGENRGINFGLGGDGVNSWVWVGIAVAICAWLLWWISRHDAGWPARVSAGLVVGGALGNVIDRLLYGYVLDFLNMSCCGIRNPYAFNVADIFIFAGAVGLVFLTPDPKKAA